MAEVKLYDPIELDRDDWRQLQTLDREAFKATLDRSSEEIDALVDWNDPSRYYTSHVNPNSEVGRRFNANQVYTHPKIAVAKVSGELAGFSYSAHNASGGGSPEGPHNDSPGARTLRRGKLLSVVKNYLWVREVVVGPDYQRQGVAIQLGRTLLKDAIPLQPVAAYDRPKLIPFIAPKLSELGFYRTTPVGKEKPDPIFGEENPVALVRYQAPSARSVLAKLR